MDKNSKWYAVFVKTGEERNVRNRIEFKKCDCGLRIVIPMRIIREYRKTGIYEEVIKPLYPGYILLNGSPEIIVYNFLKDIPGVIRLIGDRSGPVEIPPEEIEVITRLIDSGERIGVSNAIYEGNRIIITDGPLKGMEGLIKSVDKRKKRVKIRTSFLGEEKIVELGIEFINFLE